MLPCRGLSLRGVKAEPVSPGRCPPSLPILAFTCTQEPRHTFARRRVSGIRRGWVQRGRHAGEQPRWATRGRCDPSLRSSGTSRPPRVPTQARTAARRALPAAAPARRKGKEKAYCVISPRFSWPAERGRLPRAVPAPFLRHRASVQPLQERLPCRGILITHTPKTACPSPCERRHLKY